MYKALRKDNDKAVAIKILPAEEDMTKLSLEITFLKRLSSPYVVSYIEGYLFENELWVCSYSFLHAILMIVDRDGVLRGRIDERFIRSH